MNESHGPTTVNFDSPKESADWDDDAFQRGGMAQTSSVHPLERISSWIGVIAAVAVVVCLAVLAIPYLASARSGKATNPLDWWLRFGGAQSDQTFEKFLRDRSSDYQREWDENYRKSPMYKFDSDQTKWQFDLTPRDR